ncbi:MULTISPECIES: hypothetical protein [unclassified Chelatococcus]|uniref:hypothetical protein n=1 Tax=unclassified Chelatococcus TaxID=2638111 RepID=UPI001BCC359E|nr:MULTISPECIES: hypothetical protein [unclassified Chelatococcus]MBS7742494.1 hypothetical protein [Chelatococcus sp. HY11]MCO5075395.1 hypothetical protein [Chelatococcus sp.]CAH1656185.1 conserved hypothetical protein [Hyphomicrobiales bacterium]CAH1695765.1 conserved hypothetical protein [Hyphomicrobiales bacterium]
MNGIGLIWLIDADPPSEAGGGKGFYPASRYKTPPDPAVMMHRFQTIGSLVDGEAGGRAVITLHTSPRYRNDFFEGPYHEFWQQRRAAGTSIALHPHEDREDGSSLYDDLDHLEKVIDMSMTSAVSANISFDIFRSGGFSFHPNLPALLRNVGLAVDCSAAPGQRDISRAMDWPATQVSAIGEGERVIAEIPLGWNGSGTAFEQDYLYNEKQDLEGLKRVWDYILKQSEASRIPRAVNFLTHAFGLVDPHWREQAIRFLDWACRHGGALVNAEGALRMMSLTTLSEKQSTLPIYAGR